MTDYIVLEATSKYDLAVEVKKYLEWGYSLTGGVAVVMVGYKTYYAQAVCK